MKTWHLDPKFLHGIGLHHGNFNEGEKKDKELHSIKWMFVCGVTHPFVVD